jgi:hypothetical protein
MQTARLTMTGSAYPYTIPANVSAISFHALDGDITMLAGSGTAVWTIKTGQKESYSGRDLPGKVLTFTGTEAKILEIVYRTGPMC